MSVLRVDHIAIPVNGLDVVVICRGAWPSSFVA
ncbi:hypothetical protein PG102015_0140 [Bifidobacterium pseudolongum subsp. globosum]|jgi:hypothetical protein|nr:hypothetical protein PG102015_0140 [Bifidobacterium pseudolongum subsp. globosum]RYQ09021.1 hypothetical protein PG2105B_0062 [Bifidobacterium pseudolongum subsp. globosum]RYQ32715.1 hypothetical protein PG2019B_0123 [Bifidobacterium pseudolongum subsp. globosum]RYQ46218.1 hypothetical protein PG1791B_0147 [Bifidobacterium pseudolongum subsp. globosum]RYQ56890.1 hypothetical protein PG1578B_0201 [Bifidobacterium pseudolongum subsp. globosum]